LPLLAIIAMDDFTIAKFQTVTIIVATVEQYSLAANSNSSE
jgi:hypothetical protein